MNQRSDGRRQRTLSGLAAAAIVLIVAQAHAQTDPLPSWNDGPTKKAIVKFVQATTDTEGIRTYSYGTAVRNADGSITPTVRGAAAVRTRVSAIASHSPRISDSAERIRIGREPGTPRAARGSLHRIDARAAFHGLTSRPGK